MPLSRINAQSLTDGTIVASEIADGAITTAKIADDAVTSAKTDVTTLGTVEASKVVTADANGDVTFPTTSKLLLKTGSQHNPAMLIEGSGPNELLFAGDHTGSTIADKKVDGVSLLYRTTPNDLEITRSQTNGLLAKFSNGNASANPATTPRVELYHNNNIKLETTSDGIKLYGGIDFSETSDASGMTSELFDDYEEGTWTPVMTSFNHTTQIGRYIKIGKAVTVHAQIVGTSTRSGASISVGGLPFTVNATSNFHQSASVGGHSNFGYTTSFDDVTARFDPNTTNITFLRNRPNNNHDGVQASQQGTSSQIFHVGGTYIAN